MRRRLLLLGAAVLAACTPSLGTFDALAPRDSGVRRVRRDVVYGPSPRQRLDVYAPTAVEAPRPIIVFLYGGSWSSGSKDDYEFMGAALASQGFVAVLPDYRLVPDVRFPTFIEDCAAALRWVQDHAAECGGDPRSVVLMGHSAGAYNAAMLALDAHYLRDAGVDASAIRGMIGLAGPYDFLPYDVDSTRNAFGQAPDPALTQPVHFARADAPPLYLLWGAQDTTVRRRSIDGLERAVHAAGGRVESKIYPNLDHVGIMLALSRVFRGRAPVLADAARFARSVTA
jgi:acetyl esterase/lipase